MALSWRVRPLVLAQTAPEPFPSPLSTPSPEPVDEPSIKYSDRFNDEDAEVTYESCDGVRFRVHAVYLEAHTGGLAPPAGMSLAEVVTLTEPAAVLEFIFESIYPIPKLGYTAPDDLLSYGLEIGLLGDFAEAAEKYQIFPAMSSCVIAMRNALPSGALEILAHARRHNYLVLADEAAPYLLDKAPSTVVSNIPSEWQTRWLSYYEGWVSIQREILTEDLPRFQPPWSVVTRLAGSLRALEDLDVLLEGCSRKHEWKTSIQVRIQDSILPLSGSKRRFLRRDAEDPSYDDDLTYAEEDSGGVLTISSKDKKMFTIRRKVLLACAPGFKDIVPDAPSSDDPSAITLPESGQTLERLLGFLRPVRSPLISSLSFNELQDLAYAAEKYRVFQAMYICSIFMRKMVPGHNSDVFIYAATFGYTDTMNEAAPLVIDQPFAGILRKLPAKIGFAWAAYYEKWRKVCEHATKTIVEVYGNHKKCSCSSEPRKSFLHRHGISTIVKLASGPGSLRKLYTLFSDQLLFELGLGQRCEANEKATSACLESIKKSIDAIGEFSGFLAMEEGE